MIRGKPEFAPWQDDPDPPAYWGDEEHAEMRRRLRAHWGTNVGDRSWDESKHPRGQPENKGQFGSGGGGSTSASKRRTTKLPKGVLPKRSAISAQGASASEALAAASARRAGKRTGPDGHPGEGYSKEAKVVNGVLHTTNVEDAARGLQEGRKVEIDQPRGISIVLERLGEIAALMIEKGEKAPTINLCNLTIKGSNLFCAQHKDIPRIEMPQMDEGQTQEFLKHLKANGHKVTNEEQFASHLRATQNELNGVKVAGIAEKIRSGKYVTPRTVVSDDDYVLDGHHRWAAKVGNDAMDNTLTNDTKMPVSRVHMSITQLLEEAHKFTGGKGRQGLHDKKAWDEDLHPRGQPENKGQFGPGGGGAGKSEAKRAVGTARGLVARAKEAGRSVREQHEFEVAEGMAPSPRTTSKVGATAAEALAASRAREGEPSSAKIAKTREAVQGAVVPPEGMTLAQMMAESDRLAGARSAEAVIAAGTNAMDEPVEGEKSTSGERRDITADDFEKAGITLRTYDEEDAVLEDWNKFVGMHPEQFKKEFMGGLSGSMRITGDADQDIFTVSGKINGEKEFKGMIVGEFDRQLNFSAKTGYSEVFQVDERAQKHGYGKKLLAGNIAMYEKFGFKEVKVTAGLKVGAYAWAKYGYVPHQDDWDLLREKIKYKVQLERGETGAGERSSSNTIEATDWSELGTDAQEETRTRWYRETHDEYLDGEIDNWRESGQALEESKKELVDEFNGSPRLDWAQDALNQVREDYEVIDKFIPFTDEQIMSAITLEYSSRHDDGNGDMTISWNDDKLMNPQGVDPKQGTLPGIEATEPWQYLTDEMRQSIETRMGYKFGNEAERMADDVEPPSYLGESVEEYQDQAWEDMDDSRRLDYARRYGQHEIEIEPEEDEELEAELESGDEVERNPDAVSHRELMRILNSGHPKSIWELSDHPRGKELLLRRGWSGKLNMRDPDSMRRFHDYVSRVKK